MRRGSYQAISLAIFTCSNRPRTLRRAGESAAPHFSPKHPPADGGGGILVVETGKQKISRETKMGSLGFFAYPEASSIVSEAVRGAAALSDREPLKLKLWESVTIIGFKLDDLIRDQIHEANVLAADITYPNHNVFYEIGYAIAVGKPVIPTVNIAIDKAIERIQKIGLFDTLGWATYVNSVELSAKLRDWNDISWSNKYSRRRNHAQPLFILDTLKRLISGIKSFTLRITRTLITENSTLKKFPASQPRKLWRRFPLRPA
jgi:hypothetical protein